MIIRPQLELNGDEFTLLGGTDMVSSMITNKYTFDSHIICEYIRYTAKAPFFISRENYPRNSFVVYFADVEDLNRLIRYSESIKKQYPDAECVELNLDNKPKKHITVNS